MYRLKFLFLLPILLLGAFAVQAQTVEATTPVITLERTACFGACPVYTVEIYADGTVMFNGTRFTQATGAQSTQIDPATVTDMVAAIKDAGYFDWNDAYTHMTVSDLPSVITSVTVDGTTKRIERYTGDTSAPLALPFLEQWIDAMANTGMWTGKPMDVSSISNNGESPVATIQRTACFGRCPVYTAALYADGTIVFTGIANVKTLGVKVIKGDTTTATSIAQIAEATGYFDWQDTYDHITRTDQSTVITSVQSGDQFKQITHYLGDANAPIGLTWVEQSIDQAVSDLI